MWSEVLDEIAEPIQVRTNSLRGPRFGMGGRFARSGVMIPAGFFTLHTHSATTVLTTC